MNRYKLLLSWFTLLVFTNFFLVLFTLSIWYKSPVGYRAEWSPQIRTLAGRILQRNILGHQSGSLRPHQKLLYVIRNSGLVVRNNSIEVTLGSLKSPSLAPTDPLGNLGPILDIFHKALFREDSTKRLAIKNKRLDRIYDVWNITFDTHTSICSQGPNDHIQDDGREGVIAVVNSAPANFEARAAIRNTWGRAFLADSNKTRLVFFIGQVRNTSVQRDLVAEAAREADIVRADFHEDYNNLTLKSVLILRWISLHCQMVKFVLKVDDDVFINVANLRTVLEDRKALRRTIFGNLARGWTPVRNPDSHYFVPEAHWAASIYPDFVAGPAYVMNTDAVPMLLGQVSSVPYFFLEDVYVTGMCAQKAGVARIHQPGFRALVKPLNPCTYHGLVTSHGLSPGEMTRVWDLLGKYGPKAKECWEETCVWNWLGVCMDKKRTAVNFGNLTS